MGGRISCRFIFLQGLLWYVSDPFPVCPLTGLLTFLCSSQVLALENTL